jgi:hypothetical protein
MAVMVLSCSKTGSVAPTLAQSEEETVQNKPGAAQISGLGFYALPSECDFEAIGADYAVRMTGDIEGCLYTFIEEFSCSPSGTYREEGHEYFVGTYMGQSGTFETTYKFEAKYEGCPLDGEPLGAEIFGRCQHPITPGSGTGVFEGATGRLDMKDDVAAGNFPYRGHIKLP